MLLLAGVILVAVIAVWLARPSQSVPPGDLIEPVDEEALAEGRGALSYQLSASSYQLAASSRPLPGSSKAGVPLG